MIYENAELPKLGHRVGLTIDDGIKSSYTDMVKEEASTRDIVNSLTECLGIEGDYGGPIVIPDPNKEEHPSARLARAFKERDTEGKMITSSTHTKSPLLQLAETELTVGDLIYDDLKQCPRPFVIYETVDGEDKKTEIHAGEGATLFGLLVGLHTPIGVRYKKADVEAKVRGFIASGRFRLEDPFKIAKEDKTPVAVNLAQTMLLQYSKAGVFDVWIGLEPQLSYLHKMFEDHFIQDNFPLYKAITRVLLSCIEDIESQQERIRAFNMSPGILLANMDHKTVRDFAAYDKDRQKSRWDGYDEMSDFKQGYIETLEAAKAHFRGLLN